MQVIFVSISAVAELVDASRIGRNYNVDVRKPHIICGFESRLH